MDRVLRKPRIKRWRLWVNAPLLLVLALSQSPAPAAAGEMDKASSTGPHKPDQPKPGPIREPLSVRIDRIIDGDYLGPAVPLATDTEFHRRVYLDLVGRGPTAVETESFLERLKARPGASQAIRAEVIEDLLGREEFSRYFAKVLEVMFTERREVIGLLEFRAWLRQCLEERRPLNEICLEVLAADGTGDKLRPAAAFILNRNADANQVTRDVGRIFLGRDLQCAQCHDHPHVEDYKQAEYFGLLSFVNRTYLFQDEKQSNKPFLGERAEGELEFSSVFRPKAGKTAAKPVLPIGFATDAEPDFLDTADAYIVQPEKGKRGVPRHSRRQQLAVLVTHPENTLFNRNLANRLWAFLMGRGLVDPVDMHHPGNPPASSELLRTLAEELVAARYDLREFVRQVARSAAYQRSVAEPDLREWPGPKGGERALTARLESLEADGRNLAPRLSQVEKELGDATAHLLDAQKDLDLIQRQLDGARKELQDLVAGRTAEAAKLSALQKKQGQAQESIAALQGAIRELDKLVALSPQDKDLATARATLASRLASATQARQSVDGEVKAQEELAAKSAKLAEDQRGRVLALAGRKMALAGFVVEARGGLRRAHARMAPLRDRESDIAQRKRQVTQASEWLKARDSLQAARRQGKAGAAADLEAQFRLLQSGLVESWRRGHAIRRVRGLNGEQMGVSIYHALELDRPVRAKAMADWEARHQKDPATRGDITQRRNHEADAVAGNLWDVLEKDVMRRFSAPPGAPQDGFIASVDQALMLQNDPKVQAWLKPNPGTLTHRLAAIGDPGQLARQVYLAVLGRLPDADELKVATGLLREHAKERDRVIQELVWGLLASAEFRFIS